MVGRNALCGAYHLYIFALFLYTDTMVSLLRHSLITVSGSVCSRALGFVRDASLAWLLGSSTAADAVTTALRLPYLVRRLYGEGSLSLELAAHCVRLRYLYPDGDLYLAARVGRLALYWGAAILVGCWVLAYPLIWLIAPGIGPRPEVQEQAVTLFRMCAGYMPLAMLAAVATAVLHGREQFAMPALTGSAFNLTVIGCIGAAAWGIGLPAHMVVFGVLLGGVAQLLVQAREICALRKRSQPLSVTDASVVSTQARKIFARLPLGFSGAAAPQLMFVLSAALTSLTVDGSLSALFYAERLMEFPIGVLGAAIGMASAPYLAKIVAEHGEQALLPKMSSVLEVSLLVNLPAAAGLVAVAEPLTRTLLGHGAFGPEGVALTAAYLCAYAPGLPAYGLSRPLLAACHAVEDRQTPLRALAFGLACTLAGGTLFWCFLDRMGPPLGVALGLWAYVLVLRRGLEKRLGTWTLPQHRLARSLCGSVLAWLVADTAVRWTDGSVKALLWAVPAGIVAYALVMLLERSVYAEACRRIKFFFAHSGR